MIDTLHVKYPNKMNTYITFACLLAVVACAHGSGYGLGYGGLGYSGLGYSGYGATVIKEPIIIKSAPIIKTVPIIKSVPIIRNVEVAPIISSPIIKSVGYGGYGLGLGGYGLGKSLDYGLGGGYGLSYGGYGKSLGYGGYGKYI